MNRHITHLHGVFRSWKTDIEREKIVVAEFKRRSQSNINEKERATTTTMRANLIGWMRDVTSFNL
jgi:hypothetical protein